jgi:hypothetical protein
MFRSELGKDERLLWYGKPRQGLLLRSIDAFLIPFSLIWGGGVLLFFSFIIGTQSKDGEQPILCFVATPFILWALYVIFGRFIVDVYLRSRTFYAVTNERVLILAGLLNRDVRSLSLKSLADLHLKLKKDGSGTILFGSASPLGGMYDYVAIPGLRRTRSPSFELIDDARTVYELVRQAQKEMR